MPGHESANKMLFLILEKMTLWSHLNSCVLPLEVSTLACPLTTIQALGLCMKRCLCSQWRMLITLILCLLFSLSPPLQASLECNVFSVHSDCWSPNHLPTLCFHLKRRWALTAIECMCVCMCSRVLRYFSEVQRSFLWAAVMDLVQTVWDLLLEQHSGIL